MSEIACLLPFDHKGLEVRPSLEFRIHAGSDNEAVGQAILIQKEEQEWNRSRDFSSKGFPDFWIGNPEYIQGIFSLGDSKPKFRIPGDMKIFFMS